jgi:hypothetical protein
MSESTPNPPPQSSALFSYEQFNTIVYGLGLIYSVGERILPATQGLPCDNLVQAASVAFPKLLLSLLGFLRFIPSSRFYAKEAAVVIDLSSASVMARQVMEDAISVFYLAELNLTAEEKDFRGLVWALHGASEAMEAARFGKVSHLEHTPAAEAAIERLKESLEKHPLLAQITPRDRRNRIKKGDEGHVLHDSEILSRRGIQLDLYNMGRKILSNFAHFSGLSHRMMMQTSGDWQKSWRAFLQPVLYAANFAAEALEAYLALFPERDQLITAQERVAIANCRSWLRSTFEPRVLGTTSSN